VAEPVGTYADHSYIPNLVLTLTQEAYIR